MCILIITYCDRFPDTQIVTAMQQLVIKSMCYLRRKTRLHSNKYGQLLIPRQWLAKRRINTGNPYDSYATKSLLCKYFHNNHD
jgi:hypothetical protein